MPLEEGRHNGERMPGLCEGTLLALGFLDLCGNEEAGRRSRDSPQYPVVYEKTGRQNGHKNSLSRSDVILNTGFATDGRGHLEGCHINAAPMTGALHAVEIR